MIQSYVRFYYAGLLFSENSDKKVTNRNPKNIKLPKNAYAFSFFDREEVKSPKTGEMLYGDDTNHSPMYVKGVVYDEQRVKKEVQNNDILLSNMRINKYTQVVKCAQGFLPLNKNTIVIDW